MNKYKSLFYLLLLLTLIPARASASVSVTAFFTQAGDDTITIIWETESEIQVSGYNVYRTLENVTQFSQINNKVRVNNAPIAPVGGAGGTGSYELVDKTPLPSTTYYYWLEETDDLGVKTAHPNPAIGRIERGTVIGGVTPNPITPSTVTTTATAISTAAPTTTSSNPATATLGPSVTPVATTQSTAATATPAPDPTATSRVFITPSANNSSNPTATSTVNETDTATATATALPTVGGSSNAQPTTVIIAPTESIVIQPTAINSASANTDSVVVVQPTVVATLPETTNDAGGSFDDSADLDTSSEPTGEIIIDDSEVVIQQPIGIAPTEESVGDNEPVGDLVAQVNPNEIGNESVTDVQQPTVVQPQADDNTLFLWFGLVAGGLLILVGAGFAMLFLGNRKQ